MRDFKGMKRQRGRNNRGGSGGKPQQHNANRAFDSNGPEGVKVRGAAQSVYEKYQQLARDATSSGDRVLAENYLQHAEHYFRVLRAIQPNRPVSDIVGKDVYAAYEIDFEAEPPEEPEVAETPAQPEGQGEGGENGEGGEQRRDRFENRDRNRDRDRNFDNNRNRDDRPRDNNQGEGRRDRWRDRDDRDRNRDDRPRDDRPRDDRPRDDRPRDDRPRDDRPRDDRPRDDRPREDRFRDRDDRPRDDRPREDRPVAAEGDVQPQAEGESREGRRRGRDRNRDRDWQPRGDRDPLAVIEPEASPLPTSSAPASESSPVLRGQDGAVSEAPAFLGRKARATAAAEPAAPAAEAPAADGEEVKKPRRRRAPRSFEAGEGAPTSSGPEEA
ncbi:DUF4167 domain-containing protein [Caulobacter sp. FWC2]|uniref:DUF4167 domain-containing protein n=1 Tax=Caulobacter sp. FWC2 TaxID=69664 RepID=UPI000C15483B|nr:DUF4167 domain-containing protein [Caulobacter sp. FWC2]PIB93608.1 hypothetical protein CSW62_19750 [Caulobacter sp. FWC2]